MKNKIFILCLMFLFLFPSLCFSEVKTFIKEYTYHASEDDSRNSSRVTAMREVKRLLLEELGTYLESVTEVKNFQLTKDQITALTAGIVKTEIVSDKWDGHTYWIKTKIVADEGDVIKSIDSLRKDRDKSGELDEVKKQSDAILEENKKLRQELKLAKGEDKEKQIRKYHTSIKELSAIEWIESGIRNGQKGDYETSLQDFNKAIELNPKASQAYYNRGILYYKLGKYNEALVDFNKAIELNPKADKAYNNRGTTYSKFGKRNEALALVDYNKAIELNPNDAMAYANRARVYYRLKRYNEALVDFSKAIELNPNYNNAYYYDRGLTYCMLGKYNECIADCNKAIEFNPNDARAYSNRGNAYAKLGKHNDAIDDYNKAIELDPRYAVAYFNLACLHSLLGYNISAINHLSKAIQLNPDYRNKAKKDKDFDNIRNRPDFKRLIGE